MHNGAFIIDAVSHVYNMSPGNYISPDTEYLHATPTYNFQVLLSPANSPYRLTSDEYHRKWSARETAHALFHESDTDMAIYHQVDLSGYYKDGFTPLSRGVEMRELYPNRVRLYGYLDPFKKIPEIFKDMEDLVLKHKVIGFKIYPATYKNGRTEVFKMDDPHKAFPVFEKALELGIRNIAVHKAVPVGPTPARAWSVEDMDDAAASFPKIDYQIVHGGFLYLEDTSMQLAKFRNVYVNLECTCGYITNYPRKFAEIIGPLLFWGGSDKIIYASGCMFQHPQPLIEGIWNFKMPEDLQKNYGYPDLTEKMKRKILGENFARLHGIDIEKQKRIIDEERRRSRENDGLSKPWALVRNKSRKRGA